VYSEELMTVSVGTDYTKPDPRERGGGERESLQANGTTKGIGEFLLKISVDEEVMIFSGHCEIHDGVVNHFTASHFFRFGIYYTHQPRTRIFEVAMCCTARIDRWPWLVYVAFTLQYIHTCINFYVVYFILFYFTHFELARGWSIHLASIPSLACNII